MALSKSEERKRTFREVRFREMMKDVEMHAKGFDTKLRPLTLTPAGRYSEANTVRLVRGMVDKNYMVIEKKPEEYSFYESLLYCAVRALTTEYALEWGGWNADWPSFGELLDHLHTRHEETFRNQDGMLWQGEIKMGVSWMMHAALADIYSALTDGKKLPGSDVLQGEFTPTAEPFEEPQPEDYLDPEEAAEEIETQEMYAQMAAEQAKELKRSFPAADSFCRHYENLVRLYPKQFKFLYHDSMVKRMIEGYLQEKGLNIFSDEESYLTMMTYMRKMLKVLAPQRRER